MKFLSDENLPRSILLSLRKKGFDVKDIQEEGLREIGDQEICQLAKKEERIILTYDKDFLIPKDKPVDFKAIVFHFPKTPPGKVIPYLESLVQKIASGKIKHPFVIFLSQERAEILR